jgi:hypothetical protein
MERRVSERERVRQQRGQTGRRERGGERCLSLNWQSVVERKSRTQGACAIKHLILVIFADSE